MLNCFEAYCKEDLTLTEAMNAFQRHLEEEKAKLKEELKESARKLHLAKRLMVTLERHFDRRFWEDVDSNKQELESRVKELCSARILIDEAIDKCRRTTFE